MDIWTFTKKNIYWDIYSWVVLGRPALTIITPQRYYFYQNSPVSGMIVKRVLYVLLFLFTADPSTTISTPTFGYGCLLFTGMPWKVGKTYAYFTQPKNLFITDVVTAWRNVCAPTHVLVCKEAHFQKKNKKKPCMPAGQNSSPKQALAT